MTDTTNTSKITADPKTVAWNQSREAAWLAASEATVIAATPADAATVAWNQRREREWLESHPGHPSHAPADAETVTENQRKEREWLEAPARVEALLRELCPNVFCDPPKPLAIGIAAQMIQLLDGEFHPSHVGTFLRGWVSQSTYREAVAQGGPRYDLDGVPTGQVSESHKAHAEGQPS